MLFRVGALPEDALDAAASFYADIVPQLRRELEKVEASLVIGFEPAAYTHNGWRLSAIQQLARDYAPLRINAVASDEEEAIAAAVAFLEQAEGVTGQLMPLDGEGAVPYHPIVHEHDSASD